jgi:transmembrane sensor
MTFGERIQEALELETRPNEQLRMARVRLLEHVTGTERRAPSVFSKRLRYAGLAAVGMLGLAAVVGLLSARPISFATSTGQGNVGDVLEAARRDPLPINFSEGSKIVLHEGSRARVLATQTAGARVLLESGVADVSIVHRRGGRTRWRFEAGPFQVLVKGTQFELGWQPAGQWLSLTMKAGSVELSGSCLPAPRIVARGASIRMSCAKAAPPEEPAEAARAQTPQTPATAAQTKGAPSTTVKPSTREPRAVPQSFEASCDAASKAELVAWANRERLAGSVTHARTALLALRRHFSGSNEAGTAAFTLGRMAFDQQADYGEAARWFASYLSEQPNGPLMGDAAGRLLEAHERQGNLAAARHDAQAYLRRFPDGPYAARARRILAE